MGYSCALGVDIRHLFIIFSLQEKKKNLLLNLLCGILSLALSVHFVESKNKLCLLFSWLNEWMRQRKTFLFVCVCFFFSSLLKSKWIAKVHEEKWLLYWAKNKQPDQLNATFYYRLSPPLDCVLMLFFYCLNVEKETTFLISVWKSIASTKWSNRKTNRITTITVKVKFSTSCKCKTKESPPIVL